jgi:hypothetical protein
LNWDTWAVRPTVYGAQNPAQLYEHSRVRTDPDEHWDDAVSKRLFSKNAVRAPLPIAKAQ